MVGTAGADGSTHGYIQFNPVHNQFVPTEQLAEWAAATDYHIVKLHGVHPDLDELLRTGRTWVLYIYRDLRDVAVSRQRFHGEKRSRRRKRNTTNCAPIETVTRSPSSGTAMRT